MSRLVSIFVSIAVAISLVVGLAACEYSPGDGSAANNSSAEPSAVDALMKILGPPDSSGLPYQTGPAAALSAETGPGQYVLTAGCVGASGADVSVTVGDSPPEKYSISCGMGKIIHIELPSGKLLAEVAPQEPRADTVTGLKLEHHPAPRDMAARNQRWMAEQLGPESPGEFRRFLTSGENVATGPLAVAGNYEIAIACSGPDSVDLTVLSASGEPVVDLLDVPCGPAFRTNLQLEPDGAIILLDAGAGAMRAAVSILPAKAGG